MKLVVFDLDFTLWNAGGTFCDQTFPPYRSVNSHIIDSAGSKIYLYPDVPNILKNLQDKKIRMGLASRTFEPAIASTLLSMFGIDSCFEFREIYPGSKTTHFHELAKKSGIKFRDMLFFDDEERNIREVSELGVKAVLVPGGIDYSIINRYL